MKKFKIITLCLLICTGFVNAKEHTVKLLTQGSNGKMMVFEPMFIKISVGDTINFVPSDASHNAQSFSVPSDKSSFNTPYGKPTKVTFTETGAVLVKCLPHFALGMIAVVQVGENIDSSKVNADWLKAKASVVMNKEAIDEALTKINQ
ncbi:MAG: pseudoazurin [Colwellia sp.]|nr:pseudoazurin [Colwellia sp.]